MTIRGKYSSTAEDTLTSYWMYRNSSNNQVQIRLITAALIFATLTIAGYLFNYTSLSLGGAILAIIIMAGTFYEWYQIRRSHTSPTSYEFEISNQHIFLKSPNAQSSSDWTNVKTVKIDQRGMLLIRKDESIFFFPARSFENGFNADQIRSLVQASLVN